MYPGERIIEIEFDEKVYKKIEDLKLKESSPKKYLLKKTLIDFIRDPLNNNVYHDSLINRAARVIKYQNQRIENLETEEISEHEKVATITQIRNNCGPIYENLKSKYYQREFEKRFAI